MEAALSDRIGTTDAGWALIGRLLPSERGRGCRPAGDNRLFFNGMMWIARSSAQWRRLAPGYGEWNSVFRRSWRWLETGVFDALLETLAGLAGRDRAADMINSTVVRAQPLCCGPKRGAGQAQALGRSRGGFFTRLHTRCDARDLPLGFVAAPGQAYDIQGFRPLLRVIDGLPRMLLADRSYDADTLRGEIALAEIRAVIPVKRKRRQLALHSRSAYRLRNRVERMFNKLKNWRRVAVRYEKTAASYLSFVSIASAFLCISFIHEH